MLPLGVVITILSALAYGIYPASAQKSYADGANPALIILLSTFLRGAALAAFCLLARKGLRPKPHEWRNLITVGILQALSVFGIIGALLYLPGPVMITLIFTSTFMLLLFLAFKGEATLSFTVIAATLSALFGVSLVVDAWHALDSLSIPGISLSMMAAVMTVGRMYIFGKQLNGGDPPVVGAQVFLVATIFCLPLLLVQTPHLPLSAAGYLWVGLCCLSLVAGTFGTFYGIAMLGPFRSSLMGKVEPIFTAIFSFIILGEVLNTYQYAGILLVIGSLGFFQYSQHKKQPREATVIQAGSAESVS